MTIIVLQKSDTIIRKTLEKYMIAIKPDVFLGNPNKRIREFLWDKTLTFPAMMAYNDNSPQGFSVIQTSDWRPEIRLICGVYMAVLS